MNIFSPCHCSLSQCHRSSQGGVLLATRTTLLITHDNYDSNDNNDNNDNDDNNDINDINDDNDDNENNYKMTKKWKHATERNCRRVKVCRLSQFALLLLLVVIFLTLQNKIS